MKFSPLHRGAALALVPLLLLAGWLYLYTHSHSVDTLAQGQTLAWLKDLKQLDSDWSADVLRSHADIHLDYDALVAPLVPFVDGLARLRKLAGQAPGLAAATDELAQAIEAKAALIDDFKAQNSLFKNSLRYVPTAHQDIQSRWPAGSTRQVGQLAFLVNEAMRYSALPDGAVATSLLQGIAGLRTGSAPVPPPLREAVANLLAHLDTLLRLRGRQSELLRAISQVPVAARIDTLAAQFTQRFDAELASQFRYQRLLLAYSAVALLLVSSGAGFIAYRNATERRRLRLLVEEKTHELNELATRDELTRLHNRRHITELLAQQMASHARSGLPICIALLDIDHFKTINDRHGHAAGDAVLLRFATLARQVLRAVDLLGRWGGEEFLVLLPQTSLDQAELALQRFGDALAQIDFGELGREIRISFSGGLVLLAPSETLVTAVGRADEAMYRAKTAGRRRIEKG